MVRRQELKEQLPRLMRNQILMKMMIYHHLRQTRTETDHSNCILIQIVVLILKLVHIEIGHCCCDL